MQKEQPNNPKLCTNWQCVSINQQNCQLEDQIHQLGAPGQAAFLQHFRQIWVAIKPLNFLGNDYTLYEVGDCWFEQGAASILPYPGHCFLFCGFPIQQSLPYKRAFLAALHSYSYIHTCICIIFVASSSLRCQQSSRKTYSKRTVTEIVDRVSRKEEEISSKASHFGF